VKSHAWQQVFDLKIQIPEIHLVAVGSPGVREIYRAKSERARSDGAGRKVAEVNVLERGGKHISRGVPADTNLKTICGVSVRVIAAAWWRLKEAPPFDAAPVTKTPGRGRGVSVAGRKRLRMHDRRIADQLRDNENDRNTFSVTGHSRRAKVHSV
jgi:hypothetical protein